MNFVKNIFLSLTRVSLAILAKTNSKLKTFKLLPFATTLFIALFSANAFSSELCEKALSGTARIIKEAEEGNAVAQFNLGLMYLEGALNWDTIDIPKDLIEAAKWFRLAAEQGMPEAQFNLGLMYKDGDGVMQDYAEATKWYKLAAEQEFAPAQFNLGLMYDKGEWVEKDYIEAAKWYKRAATRGYAQAQNNLGVLYLHGRGVDQSDAKAVYWFSRAVKNGDKNAKSNLIYMETKNGKSILAQ